MRFGLITPVFEGCLASLELLFKDLEQQTFKDWEWILCNNGQSNAYRDFVQEKHAMLSSIPLGVTRSPSAPVPRIEVIFSKYQPDDTTPLMIGSLSHRRNYGIEVTSSDFIFMIDADAQLVDPYMFEKIHKVLVSTGLELCIWKIRHESEGVLPLPQFPFGGIDLLNFCVSTRVAEKVGYYDHKDPDKPCNDYWFFHEALEALAGRHAFIDEILAVHNGNRRYSTVSDKVRAEEERLRYHPLHIVKTMYRRLRYHLKKAL